LIGGEYFIAQKPVEDSLLYSLTSVCANLAFFSSGRDAFYTALVRLDGVRIWLPDFICKPMFDAAQHSQKALHFYPVDAQLAVSTDWVAQVRQNDIVLVSHLFGMMQTELLNRLSGTGAVVISDLTQTVYSLTSWQAAAARSTLILSSLRQTAALPDGAILASAKHDIAAPEQLPSDEFWVTRAAALLSRGGSANQGFMSDENYRLFKKAALWLDANPAASRKMSDCSRYLLATMSENEWESQRLITHHNQAILATHLSDKVPCPQVRPTRTLPEISISTFFPILLEPDQRTRLKAVLADQRIYCPIHWDTAFLGSEHVLSKKILSIPCDARYNDRDMKYIATVITANL